MADLTEAWRILQPGGMVLGHDCIPYELANASIEMITEDGVEVVNGVRHAVNVFAEMHNVDWKILYGTWHMFYIMKPNDD